MVIKVIAECILVLLCERLTECLSEWLFLCVLPVHLLVSGNVQLLPSPQYM